MMNIVEGIKEEILKEKGTEEMEETEKNITGFIKAPEEGSTGEDIPEKEVRPYTLRKFKDGDLWTLLKILRKIGIKEYKEAFIQNTVEKKDTEKMGILVAFDMADMLIENVFVVEDDVYTLYSDMSGLSVDEIRSMEFGTLPLMILDSLTEVKNTSFLKVLSRLL